MTDPTIQQIICHNIVTAINGSDIHGNLSFDANLLHASPVAEFIFSEILTEYRHLLGLGERQTHPNYQDDLRDLWGPLKLVLSEFAYRDEQPTVAQLTRFVSTFVPSDSTQYAFNASQYLGKHPNRIIRANNMMPRDLRPDALFPMLRTITSMVCSEELTFAHAAVVKYNTTFTAGFTVAIINSDEMRVMRERYSDGMIF